MCVNRMNVKLVTEKNTICKDIELTPSARTPLTISYVYTITQCLLIILILYVFLDIQHFLGYNLLIDDIQCKVTATGHIIVH